MIIDKYGKMTLKKWVKFQEDKPIKFCKDKLIIKGGIDMATVSFERDLILNDTSAKALAKKIEMDKNSKAVFRDIDINKKLEEGKELLRQFFSR